MSNFRPISLLSIPGRILEDIISDSIDNHIEAQDLLSDNQWGFRKNHSTEGLLLHLTDTWKWAIDENLKVGVLFIDFRKAFDSVNHTILLQKLKAVGISGNLLSWMKSYLSNRNQFVQVNEVKSDTSFIKFGVPQGSILGPKLFSLYVNDLPESITSGELDMFADDTTIFTVSDNIDIIFKAMQDILDQVFSWCGANTLIAHETKSEALLLSKQRFIGPLLPLKYGEKFIEFKSSCKCLGVTIDSNLSWQEHTKSLLKSFNKKIAVLRRIKFLPSSNLQTICFRTVLPSVLYGILVWGSCSPALMDDLERAHIRASKLIFKLSRDSNADQLNKLKGWNNLSFFYTKRLLVEAYKSYYRCNTNVLNDLVMLKQSSHCLRKSMNIKFPSPKSEIGRLTFRHRAAIAWNSLPDSIKKSSSLECFKKRLRSSKDLINSISYNKESSMIRNRNEEFLY